MTIDKFDRYYSPPTVPVQTTTMTEDVAPGRLKLTTPFRVCTDMYTDCPSEPVEPKFHYGGSFLLNAVQALQQQDNAAGGPHDELHQYLQAGVESTTDVIGWWGVSPRFI
jgi:hypothetical protein